MASDPLRDPSPPSGPGRTVVIGAEGTLGRLVVALLRDDPTAGPVTGLAIGPGAHGAGVDLLVDDLKPVLEGASVVVHLVSSGGLDLEDELRPDPVDDVESTQRVLDAAGSVGVEHVVVLSSATVYGAWANNALPLAEDATLRPCPELAFAVQRAEIERRVSEWRHDHPAATVTVLRPVPVVGDDDGLGWLADALHSTRRVADLDGDPPAQFLHVEDLASAVALAATARLDGARNVAPDGWLRGAEYTALDAGTPKVRVPRRVGDRLTRIGWWLRLAPTPPGISAYARHPWVVANDLIRSEGWEPAHSNDEAFVDGTPATALATLSPRRRQELALGITGGVLGLGLVAAIVAVVRRARRAAA